MDKRSIDKEKHIKRLAVCFSIVMLLSLSVLSVCFYIIEIDFMIAIVSIAAASAAGILAFYFVLKNIMKKTRQFPNESNTSP